MNIAIILAGGKGERLDPNIPKQFIKINNRPILFYSLNTFNKNKNIDRIILVTNKDYLSKTKNFIEKYKFDKLSDIVIGGETRQKSVYNSLEFLKNNHIQDNDIVAIHDSARAMIDSKTIDDCIQFAIKYNAVTAVIKTKDTIISSDGKTILNNLDRKFLYNVQTPQCFKFNLIYKAHKENISSNATDDTYLIKQSGKEVYLVISNNDNIKITTLSDIYIFENYLKINPTRFL